MARHIDDPIGIDRAHLSSHIKPVDAPPSPFPDSPHGQDRRAILSSRLTQAVVVADAVTARDANVAVQRDKVAHEDKQLRQVLKYQKGDAQMHHGGKSLGQ